MGEALDRWATLVRTRREQMEAQRARLGDSGDDWWAGRGGGLAAGIGDPLQPPPFGTEQIARSLGPTDRLLDIGGGAGRYAVPLLRTVGHVTVLEPSPSLAALAREHLGASPAGLADRSGEAWRVVEAEWPAWSRQPASSAEAPSSEERFDAVLLAHVLYPHEDLGAWIEAAVAAAGRWVCIVHGTVPDAPDPIGNAIEAHHGVRRIRQPDLSDLIPALHDLGYWPEVRMGWRRFRRSFDRARWAEQIATDALIPTGRDELRRLRRRVRPHLEPIAGDRLALPEIVSPVGLLTWRTDRD